MFLSNLYEFVFKYVCFHRENAIHMEYNQMDRVVKFGEGLYRYDNRGLVVQNAREERFKYNAKGLLVGIPTQLNMNAFDLNYIYWL